MKFQNKIKYFILLFIVACDFTPRIHKEILHAQKLLLDQNYSAAVTKYEKILSEEVSDPLRVKIFFQLSEIYLIHYGNNKKALDYLSQIKASSTNLEAVIKAEEKTANINFSFVHNYKQSLISYNKLMSFAPPQENSDFYKFRYGQSLLYSGDYSEAVKIFTTFSAKGSYSSLKYFYLGQAYFYSSKWKDAINSLKKYLKLMKGSEKKIEARFLLANSYESLEDLKEAYDEYYAILSTYPNPEVIKNKLNSIYERQISSKR